MSLVASAIHNQARQTYGQGTEELLFGDFCFAFVCPRSADDELTIFSSCGNATQGTPYCSHACRTSDSARALGSPEFSPALSAVPPLVESSKSVCSTPPSSLNNSPSPQDDVLPELVDPPQLDLPALATKFEYGGTSLPVGFRFPLSYSISYARDTVTYPAKELKSSSVGGVTAGFETLDLKYRRKPGMPTQAVPAPLYFRQSAAAVHPTSPMTAPTSPPKPAFSPRFSPARPPTTSTSFGHPSALSLGPSVVSDVPISPRVDAFGGKGSPATRHSSLASQSPIVTLKADRRKPDLLMSPRIRALRGASEITAISEELEDIGVADASTHSAFACYLFAHLTKAEPSDEEIATGRRGRTVQVSGVSTSDGSRSASVDSMVGRTSSAPPIRPRTSRFIFGRGAPELPATSEIELEIEPLALTPGRLISATIESSTPSAPASPFHSAPVSPPTRARSNRGRSPPCEDSLDRATELGARMDPRGRSNLRGVGAVERDLSPTRDSSESVSRGRAQSGAASRERGRESRSRVRNDRDESQARPLGAPVEETVSRGRAGRSQSRLSRGRGREIVISGAAYGHFDEDSS